MSVSNSSPSPAAGTPLSVNGFSVSNVPKAAILTSPPLGASGLTYWKCLKPGWYLRSPYIAIAGPCTARVAGLCAPATTGATTAASRRSAARRLRRWGRVGAGIGYSVPAGGRQFKLSVKLRRTSMRAIFFDAGNTLLRIDYPAIAAQLSTLGVSVTAQAVERAEWRARVRLDAELFPGGGASPESRATAARYLELVLEGVGVADAATLQAMTEWRASFNAPLGLFHLPDPAAAAALAAAREARLVTGVISN